MSNTRRPAMLSGGRDYTVMEGSHILPTNVVREIEAIRQYDPELEVYWIPPEEREEGDAEFAIVHEPPGREAYVAFFVKSMKDFDGRVMKKVIINDQRNGKTTMDELEAHKKSKAAILSQMYKDALEEANDIAHHALKSRLHTYKVNDKLTIKDDGRYGNAGI